MKVTFLGTGTSHGVPVLGCTCPVCKSDDPRDKRYRSSILLEKDGCQIVVDTGYEFRLAGLRAGIMDLDAVLYTHPHSDHIMGLDDLRVFTKEKPMPVYGDERTIRDLKTKFPYAFSSPLGYGLPAMEPKVVKEYERFSVGPFDILPIPVQHGVDKIMAYRFGNFAYVTDASFINVKSTEALRGVEVLVLAALREKKHPTHYCFSEAREKAKEIGCSVCYFTHMNHEHSHVEIEKRYAPECLPAYDNLVLEI